MKADKKQLRKDLFRLLKWAAKREVADMEDNWDDLKEADYQNAISFFLREHGEP